jgi:prepilin-type N-terminal cleavage/methylation domain-containing protein
MKIPLALSVLRRSHRVTRCRLDLAFTLPEMLIAMTVFTLLVGGIVFAHLFGLRMFQLTETKLTATDVARKTIGKMANEIRTCKSTEVGNIKNGQFEPLLDGETQEGTSLIIYPTADTNNYIIYFVNPSDSSFRRTTSTTNSAYIVAQTITNTIVFRAQNYLGGVLTNNQNNRVIHFELEFQKEKQYLRIADHYKLETAVTRRALE